MSSDSCNAASRLSAQGSTRVTLGSDFGVMGFHISQLLHQYHAMRPMPHQHLCGESDHPTQCEGNSKWIKSLFQHMRAENLHKASEQSCACMKACVSPFVCTTYYYGVNNSVDVALLADQQTLCCCFHNKTWRLFRDSTIATDINAANTSPWKFSWIELSQLN